MRWFVATIRLEKGKVKSSVIRHYYEHLESAIASITEDPEWYRERYYTHAVIEGVPSVEKSKYYSFERPEYWFELEKNKATLCDKPESLSRIVYFTIG